VRFRARTASVETASNVKSALPAPAQLPSPSLMPTAAMDPIVHQLAEQIQRMEATISALPGRNCAKTRTRILPLSHVRAGHQLNSPSIHQLSIPVILAVVSSRCNRLAKPASRMRLASSRSKRLAKPVSRKRRRLLGKARARA
jgi:hypothetical protein